MFPAARLRPPENRGPISSIIGVIEAETLATDILTIRGTKIDYAADTLKTAKTNFETTPRRFAKPTSPRPSPRLGGVYGNRCWEPTETHTPLLQAACATRECAFQGIGV